MLFKCKDRLRAMLFVLATSSVMTAADTTIVDLGEASEYNIVLFGNFSSPYYGSVEGRMAIEGNVSLENYGAVTNLNGEAGISMVIGGDLSFQYGKIYSGHILVTGSSEDVGNTVRNGLSEDQILIDGVDPIINFEQWETKLVDRSNEISLIPSNGTVLAQWGGLYLTGDCISDLQVFDLDGSVLDSSHTFQVSCIPEGAAIVFNISGASSGMSYMGLESLKPYRDRVLFNFYQATELTFTSMGIEGSVLAPLADVANPTGQLNGTVIAKSWNGPMNLNYIEFKGYNANLVACDGETEI